MLSLSAAVFSRECLWESNKVESCSRTLKKLFFLEYACDTNKLNKILWFRKNFGTHSIKLLKIGRFPKSDKLSLTFLFFCLGYVSLSFTLNQFWSFSPKFLWAEYQFKIPSGSIRLIAIPVWKIFFQISLMAKEQASSVCCFEQNQRSVANLLHRKLNVM